LPYHEFCLSNFIPVPSTASIKNGEVVKIECLDWTGGQIKNNDSADDVRDVDLTRVHYLTGPFNIETAEPGDVLVVEIQDVQPLQDQPWGFTGIFAKENGGGFLDELFPKPYVPIVISDEIYIIRRQLTKS
jgi:formamidase